MRIGFDAKRAVKNNTGLGNYSRLAVDVLSTFFPDNEYRLYTPEIKENSRLTPILQRHGVSLHGPDTVTGRMASSLWRVNGLTRQLRRDNVDLFHGLSNELPLNIHRHDIPTVVTIHDVIFRRFPEYYKPVDRAIYDYKFRKAAQRATRIIAISECTSRELQHFYNIPPEKIDIVYQGCHEQFLQQPSINGIDAARQKYGITHPYIIGVGTLERRKNQMLTVKALRGLPDDIHLVLVGRRTDYANEITGYAAANNLTDRVKIIDRVDFADLPALYAGAELAAYPSRYEGFGIPVIEAIGSGTPVIVASGSCLEEAAGPDMPVVAPDDNEAMVEAARRIIADSDLRDSLVKAGRDYITKFNAGTMARGIMDTYLKALRR